MGREGHEVTLPRIPEVDVLRSLWNPVTIDEIKAARVESAAALGPDSIKPSQCNKVPVRFVQFIFNCFISCSGIPDELILARSSYLKRIQVTWIQKILGQLQYHL